MGSGGMGIGVYAELCSLQALSCYLMGVGQWLQSHFIVLEIGFQSG